LARIDQCALAKPKQIFMMIGINDLKIGKSLAYITANQIAIIKRIKQLSPKTKIVMQSTLPVNDGMLAAIYKRLNNKAINEMNVALQKCM
jgi:lysophospholipase L1-like esterase